DYRWSQLTPQSAYDVRASCHDHNNAKDLLHLARLAWAIEKTDVAKRLLDRAVKIDPSLKDDADKILASKSGTPATTQPSDAVTKLYLPATPEQKEAAIARAKLMAKKISAEVGVQFTEIQTDHFILFTDWDPREFDFLKDCLEQAYTKVCVPFAISPKDNVFVGKLPVFMYAKRDDFNKHSQQIDHNPPAEDIRGYYAQFSNGRGYLVMWKPVADSETPLLIAEKQWAHTLTHEFVHAFVARYHNNGRIPVWLNEGLAEFIANDVYLRPGSNEWARFHALHTPDISDLFDDSSHKRGDLYPVMETMVATLIQQNRIAFVQMFNTIKDGMPAEQALQQFYGIDYKGLDKAWRQTALSH
ncbi:MAG TPA: hypothetical protein VKK61_04600, partial [Tepidisphaeraceae bacterium]|nr:hypothetical protein [Tepidisphaeraceae bacterium]